MLASPLCKDVLEVTARLVENEEEKYIDSQRRKIY